MIRKHLKLLIITSVITLLPLFAGLILWDRLPAQMPTHWNMAWEVDGWSSKAFAVFGLPLMLLGFQWLCLLGTAADPKRENHPQKVVQLVLWVIPVLSVLLHTLTFATALGKQVQMEVILPVFIGLLFSIIGNYMPKCRQNYTIGIKIPWTLNSEENWNRTHRFAGWVWTFGGLVILLTGFFGSFWLFLPITLVMVLAPIVYSGLLYRKGI